MLPFGAPWFGEEEFAEVLDTLKSGWVSTGPKTKRFEQEFADYVGAKYAIALNSCTAGLHLSLIVLGIGPGEEVIVPSLTFSATANVVEHVGARPVFVDVDPVTLTISPERAACAVTERTRAILPVHYAGMPCDMDALHEIATQHNLFVIEDAAHAVGSRYKGKTVGSLSVLTNFSFYANKNLSTAEGGMVTTADPELEQTLRKYHLHGLLRDVWKNHQTKSFSAGELVLPGYKYNMTDVQASLGIHQLHKQEAFIARREEIALFYDGAFSKNLPPELEGMIWTQPRPHDGLSRHVLHLYPILLDTARLRVDRNQVIRALLAEKIGVSMHFTPLHMMPYYREKYRYTPDAFPNARRVGESEITLPIQPQMSNRDAQDVVDAVWKVLCSYRK